MESWKKPGTVSLEHGFSKPAIICTRTQAVLVLALHMVLGRIYYKGVNFTTQAVLVLALHIVLGRIYYKGVNFTTC